MWYLDEECLYCSLVLKSNFFLDISHPWYVAFLPIPHVSQTLSKPVMAAQLVSWCCLLPVYTLASDGFEFEWFPARYDWHWGRLSSLPSHACISMIFSLSLQSIHVKASSLYSYSLCAYCSCTFHWDPTENISFWDDNAVIVCLKPQQLQR